MTNQDIFAFLDGAYPFDTALSFDNPGFLVGDRQMAVEKILVCLDATVGAVEEAVRRGCTLIVTHHPVIFDPLRTVEKGTAVYAAIQNGVSVISVHTNFDQGKNGVNDCLAKALGLRAVETYVTADGFITRKGKIDPMLPQTFAEQLKKLLGGRVKYVAPERTIETVLLCSGSGGEYVEELAAADCDALVTADCKHHQFLLAAQSGKALFDAGHFETEDISVEPLAQMLRDRFPTLAVETFHPQLFRYI